MLGLQWTANFTQEVYELSLTLVIVDEPCWLAEAKTMLMTRSCLPHVAGQHLW